MLPVLLRSLDKETDAAAQQKMLLCLSGLVRGNTSFHGLFQDLKGYEKVVPYAETCGCMVGTDTGSWPRDVGGR